MHLVKISAIIAGPPGGVAHAGLGPPEARASSPRMTAGSASPATASTGSTPSLTAVVRRAPSGLWVRDIGRQIDERWTMPASNVVMRSTGGRAQREY